MDALEKITENLPSNIVGLAKEVAKAGSTLVKKAGAYANYLLLGKSWKWLTRRCPADRFYAFPNPLMEE